MNDQNNTQPPEKIISQETKAKLDKIALSLPGVVPDIGAQTSVATNSDTPITTPENPMSVNVLSAPPKSEEQKIAVSDKKEIQEPETITIPSKSMPVIESVSDELNQKNESPVIETLPFSSTNLATNVKIDSPLYRAFKLYFRSLVIVTIIMILTGHVPAPKIKMVAWQYFFCMVISLSIAVDTIFLFLKNGSLKKYLISTYFDIPIITALFFFHKNLAMTGALLICRQALKSLSLISGQSLLSRLVSSFKLKPAQVIAATFIWIILIGTLLLMLPLSASNGQSPGFINALFTATSATCVTGLAVVDTGLDFSFFGQLVIMILFQIGGLGIMTLSTALSVIIFKKMTLSDQSAIEDMLDQSEGNVKTLLKYILSYTLIIEFIGAVLLMVVFTKTFPHHPVKALYYSVFHSISAFCNAGFGLFSDSFASFSGSWIINFTIMFLIIFGGLGFAVIYDLQNWVKSTYKKEKYRLSLHTRITLITSLILILTGAVFFLCTEYSHSFSQFNFIDKVNAALFQSVTCRTAGFSTVDTKLFTSTGLLFSIILMFIGASSGSTGGGIKTTTFALLVLRVKAVLAGRDDIEISGRTIPSIVVNKAVSISLLSILICLVFLIVLTLTEGFEFMDCFFEVVSAFGTVGLSTGITSSLTSWGKIVITFLMFIGRVGPLTLALAVGEKLLKGQFSYPEEKIMVG